jgi:TatD DNase family protein
MMIVDTHVHLDDERYADDLEEVLERSQEVGVNRWIIPGADPTTLKRAVEIAETHDNVYFSVGVHPYDAGNYEREAMERFVDHPKCIAVGEIGLDYSRLPESKIEADVMKRLQHEVFIDQIDLANRHAKPIIVHIRDASRDAQSVLETHVAESGGVLHCYNADPELLRLFAQGFYYGIGGVITFKNAKKLVDVFPLIPEDRLLIETDGPYLTPHPYRGERNEPAYCELVTEKMAHLAGIPLVDMQRMCRENTARLFGI